MAAPIKKEKELATKQRYVPDDITFQILHRLPVKSVLRFISLSKSWKSMIRTSDFVSAHHHHHHHDDDHQEQTYINYNMDKNRRSNLIYLTNDVSKRNQDCTLWTHNSTYSVFQLPLTSGYTVIGECEGLICLTMTTNNSTATYIWNPLVGTLKKLPPNIYRNPLILVSRFGFARRSRDYKVIRMICDDKAAGVTNFEIYSLAADSWRKLTCSFPTFFRALNLHVYFKGCIYCLSNESFFDDMILKFDMEEESFMILKFDMEEKISFGEMVVYMSTTPIDWEYKLVVIGKFLVALKVVTVECERKMHVSAYITEEPKSGQAWNTFEDTLSIDYDGNMPKLMKITEGGEIVLEGGNRVDDHNRMFVYDSYCDGYRLEFKFRELGIFRQNSSSNLISMKTGGTLSLLGDRNI